MQNLSPRTFSDGTGSIFFWTGTDSPVKADSSACMSRSSKSLISAGNLSPERNKTTSPGTISAASITCFFPSRITVAFEARLSSKASIALRAFVSWIYPIIALIKTTPKMTAESTYSSKKKVTNVAARRM